MNICGHIIASDQIIGIGPLIMITPSDPHSQAYNTRRMEFDLHLRNHTARIASDNFAYGWDKQPTTDPETKKAREDFAGFRDAYSTIKKEIENIVDNMEIHSRVIMMKSKEALGE